MNRGFPPSRSRSLTSKLRVEALETRQLLSHVDLNQALVNRQVLLGKHIAQLSLNPRPDLDTFAWNLASHPREARRNGLGQLSQELVKHTTFASLNGWGTLLDWELRTHPAYTVSHHLTSYLTPPTPALTTARPHTISTATPAVSSFSTPPVTVPSTSITSANLPTTENPLATAVGSTLDATIPNGGLTGSNLTYTITPQPLPANMTFNRGTGELVFTPAPDQAGTWNFAVTVSNGTSSAIVHVPITVATSATADTQVSGRVVDESNQPLAGVPVKLGSAAAITDTQGDFTLTGVSANPGPLSAGGSLTTAQDRLNLTAPLGDLLAHPLYGNVNNVIAAPLILPKINWTASANLGSLAATNTLSVNSSALAGFSLRMNPGSVQAQAASGSLASGTFQLAELGAVESAQHMPVGVSGAMLLYKAQGLDLSQPGQLTLPNFQGLQPGAVVYLLRMNMQTGGHDNIGQMVVSADGKTLTALALVALGSPKPAASGGNDIQAASDPLPPTAGCLIIANGSSPGNPNTLCAGCENTANGAGPQGNSSPIIPGSGSFPVLPKGGGALMASDAGLVTGQYLQDHQTVTYQSQGVTRGLDLQYSSLQANPKPVVQYQVTTPIASNSSSITSISVQVTVGGVIQGTPTTYTPSQLTDGSTFRIPLQIDASLLATGVYTYTMAITENFGTLSPSSITTNYEGSINVVNATNTPVGAGWSVGGLQHLSQLTAGGPVLVTAGSQGTETFDPIYNHGESYLQDLVLGDMMATPQLLANDGNGNFFPTTVNLSGSSAVTMAAGDFNGDGITDLVEAGYSSFGQSAIMIQLSNGAGGFTAGNTYSLPSSGTPLAVLVGNFTGHTNGVRDIAVVLGVGTGYQVAVYTGNGNGTFTTPVATAATGQYQSGQILTTIPAVGDFNGDGKDDLAFATSNGLVDVLLGSSSGSMTAGTGLTLPTAHQAKALTAVDYNGDGKLDLVVESANTNLVEAGLPFMDLDLFSGAGTGAFSFVSTFASTGHFDAQLPGLMAGNFNGASSGLEIALPLAGDATGYVDIIPLSSTGVWGQGTMHPIDQGTGGNLIGADLNGDGKTDLAWTDANGYLRLLLTDPASNQFLPQVTLTLPGVNSESPGFPSIVAGAFTHHAATSQFRGPTSDPSTLIHNANGTWTRTYPNGAVLQFDSSGRETSEADRNGNTTSYTYVPSGQPGSGSLKTITDPVGLMTTLAYDASGHLSTITDPAGRITTITIDSNDNLTKIVDPDGAVTQYGYSTPSNHLLTTEINPNNKTATATYNSFGQLISETLFDGTSTTSVKSAQSQGLIAVGSSGPLPMVSTYQGTVTDPNGRTTTLTFNWMAHPTTQVDGTGTTTTITYGRQGFPTSVTDPNNNKTLYTYDANGNVTSITRPDLKVETITYNDPYSVPTSITDFRGLTTVYTLDSHGNVLRRTDPDGLHEDWTYNSAGQVLTDTDRAGNVTTYQYDSLGRETKGTYPNGTALNPTQLTNVATGGAASASSANSGQPATNAFDQNPSTLWGINGSTGWLQYQFPSGTSYKITQYQVTSAYSTGNLGNQAPSAWQLLGSNDGTNWTVLDTRSGQVPAVIPDLRIYSVATPGTYSYYRLSITANNGAGFTNIAELSLMTTLPTGTITTSATAPFRSFGYDSAGNLTSVTDETGNTATITYDPMGRVQTTQDPLQAAANKKTTYAYDPAGNLLSVTDALGHVTSYAYDARNRLIGMTDAVNQGTSAHTAYDYDADGNLTSITDPLGHQTTFAYDGENRQTGSTDANGNRTTYTYDSAGRLTNVSDFNGNSIGYGYDVNNRVTSYQDQKFQTTTYAYDANGNLTGMTDPLHHATTYAYNALNQRISTTDALNHTTTYVYDVNGNLLSVTDPLGHTTTYEYDSRNRRAVQIEASGGGTTRYTYDAASRLQTVTDPVNNVTSYGYDAAGQNTTVTDPLGHKTTYAYDLVGNVTQKTDRNSRVTQYGYDADNRETTEKWSSGGSNLHTTTITYDIAGRLTNIADNASQYAFTYDNANRLLTVNDQGTTGLPQVTLTYAYDKNGNRTNLTDSLGGLTTYTYDPNNELLTITRSGTGVDPQRVSYAYNSVGEITSITRYSDLTGSQKVVGTTFTYDNANRLTGSTATNSANTVVSSYAYTLDAANRLTQLIQTWLASGTSTSDTTTYTYTNNDQLTGVTHTNTSFANESFSYDANGNRTMSGYSTGTNNQTTSDGTYNYTYDNEGNLVTKTNIATSAQTLYTYDYRNRLTEVDQFVGGVKTVLAAYTYDALNRRIGVSEGGATTWTLYDGTSASPLMDFNGSGTLTVRYLDGPSVAGVDAVLARDTPSGGVAWYLTDRLGSIADLVNNSGTVIDHVAYGVFGQVLSESNVSVGDRFKYAGMQADTVTGLDYDQARWYDPSVGKFVTQDPTGFAAGDTNLYRYADNNPANIIDPDGLQKTAPRPKEQICFPGTKNLPKGAPQTDVPLLSPDSVWEGIKKDWQQVVKGRYKDETGGWILWNKRTNELIITHDGVQGRGNKTHFKCPNQLDNGNPLGDDWIVVAMYHVHIHGDSIDNADKDVSQSFTNIPFFVIGPAGDISSGKGRGPSGYVRNPNVPDPRLPADDLNPGKIVNITDN